MNILSGMRINAKRDDVLATLRKNRETHASIVAEARQGYVSQALEELEEVKKKMAKLANGKVVALSFSLRVPVDQTKVYDTAIRMLELHQDELIELDSSQVRTLMQDQWDWTEAFYSTNVRYSKMAEDIVGASQGDEDE